MSLPDRVMRKATAISHDIQYSTQFARSGRSLIDAASQPGATPHTVFGAVDDEYWFWLNTAGYRKHQELQRILPSMPAEEVQRRFTSMTGDYAMREAFSMYTVCKQLLRQYAGGIENAGAILDYGCGWGRIIRLFLKDVEPSRLLGVDCFDQILDIARQTNTWCQFELVPTLPPTELPSNSFGLIYLFSVFSHLSEDAQLRWIEEFSRILKPGGLVVATTRSREHLLKIQQMRSQKNLPAHEHGIITAFPDIDGTLAAYDRGEFCFYQIGGGDILDGSFYGEAVVPEAYVRNNWARHLEVVDFITDRSLMVQKVIVARKN